MGAKHTAGPWEAVSNLVRTARTPTGGGFLVAECPANIGSRLEDARLIAAAPELLEALQLLLHEVDESAIAGAKDYGWPAAVSKARAAIAKATQSPIPAP